MWPFGRKQQSEQRAITSIDGFWPDFSEPSMALGHVSVSRALALVPVFAAARLLADSIASLPPVLYKKDAKGIARRQPTPKLFQHPSIHGTLFDWLHRGTTSMALNGDAIGLVTARDYYGFPTMVEWLNPEQVATQDGKLYGPGSFMNPIWWWYGRPLDSENLVHMPWFTMPYRVRGLSPVGAYQLTANVGIGAEEYAANWYQQGGVPPGTFRNTQRTFEDKDATAISNRLTARLQSRKPLVYGADWVYEPIAIKPHEALFVETMRLTATQIAVIYGIPPEKLGGTTGDPLTYNTVEQNTLDFLQMSLRPWLIRWEQTLTNCFPKPYYVKFDTNEMLRLDAKAQAEVDALSLGFNQPGWMDTDEVRAMRDLPPRGPNSPEALKAKAVQQQQDALDKQVEAPDDDNTEQQLKTVTEVDKATTNGKSPNGKISNNNSVLAAAKPAAPKGN